MCVSAVAAKLNLLVLKLLKCQERGGGLNWLVKNLGYL